MRAILLGLGLSASLLLLGAVQGATEFLPISSSGHLVILREWLGQHAEHGLSREIALHLGTLLAVVIFCGRDLRAMLGQGSAGLWRLVVGASLVTAVLAFSLKGLIETRLNTLFTAGCGLLVTSVILIVIAPRDDRHATRSLDDGSWRDGLVLGLFQSLALVPGVSRAGATLVAALLLGFTRPHAVRIAFLISIPAVAGAVGLDAVLGDAAPRDVEPAMLAGLAVSFVVGLLALRFIAVHVDSVTLRRFGLYTLALGVTAIATS